MEAGAFQDLEALVATRVGLDSRNNSIASLAEAFPNAEKDAQTLKGIGIINIVKSASGLALSLTDARLLTIWEEMRAAGFTEKTGFTPDVLEFYIAPSEFIATREATIFLDRTEGKIPADEAAAMLQSALRLMLDFFGLLRMKAFMRKIHRDAPAAHPSTSRAKATKRKAKSATKKM